MPPPTMPSPALPTIPSRPRPPRARAPRRLAARRLFGLLLLLTPLAAADAVAQTSARPAPSPGMWWNQPRFADGLGLTAEQRGDLDRLLEQHLAQRREAVETYQERRLELARAVSAGDWAEAREAGGRAAEAAAGLSRAETDLVVAVMQRLTPAQREEVAEEFPILLRRPWLRGGLGGPRRSVGTVRPGGGRPAEP